MVLRAEAKFPAVLEKKIRSPYELHTCLANGYYNNIFQR